MSSSESQEKNLKSVDFEKLKEGRFAYGDLYWKKKGGGFTKIHHAGEPFDEKQIEKLSKLASIFEDSYIHEDFHTLFNEKIQKLKNESSELKRFHLQQEILKSLVPYLWKEEKSLSHVDMIYFGMNNFYDFSDDVFSELIKENREGVKRCALAGSYVVFLAFLTGHFEFSILQDLYNLCFFTDLSLDSKHLNFQMLQASEIERLSPGDGVIYLHNAPGMKNCMKNFNEHPFRSAQGIKNDSRIQFTNRFLVDLVEKHHERIDGQGFPLGLNESNLTDLECCFIFANQIFSYQILDFTSQDARGFLGKALSDPKLQGFRSRRLSYFIKTAEAIA